MMPSMARRSSQLDALLGREVIDARVARAATVGVAVWRDGRWLEAYGAAGSVGAAPTEVDTPFDLASVTKPIVAVTCARLVERGVLDWNQPVAELLPEVEHTFGGRRTVAEHLSHRAGLRAHVELFAPLRKKCAIDEGRALRTAARSVRPEAARPSRDDEGAEQALYSDLGYLLVGAGLERVTRTPLDALIARELGPAQPPVAGAIEGTAEKSVLALGSSRQWRKQCPHFVEVVAPTELVTWRGGLLRGVVHDDNAWALGGFGCCGHAGLFGSATAVLTLGKRLLESLEARGDSCLLRRETLEELIRPRPGGSLRMGFDGKTGASSLAGQLAGSLTFGHLGYTGTSLWCDPEAHLVTVLLTNRVHPSAANARIRRARPRIQDQLFQLTWNGGWVD